MWFDKMLLKIDLVEESIVGFYLANTVLSISVVGTLLHMRGHKFKKYPKTSVARLFFKNWIMVVIVFTAFGMMTKVPPDVWFGIPNDLGHTPVLRVAVALAMCIAGWEKFVEGVAALVRVFAGRDGKKGK
jgi:hypothetical protein